MIPTADKPKPLDPKHCKIPIPFRPNGRTVLVKHLDVEETSQDGSIFIPNPNYAAHQTVRAVILALGTGLPYTPITPPADHHPKVGDVVMVHQKVGNAILLEGVGFNIVRDEDIQGYYE
jgi:co-chaperonin GroES (HSP10)